jgi:hypothetical protein
LPNVLIAQQEWILDSVGHNQTRSYLGCMEMLTKPEMPWKYVAILQAKIHWAKCQINEFSFAESRHSHQDKSPNGANIQMVGRCQ